MKPILTFIGMQETAIPNCVVPLFNDETGNTLALATCIDRFGDFGIANAARFHRELREMPQAVFASIIVHAESAGKIHHET